MTKLKITVTKGVLRKAAYCGDQYDQLINNCAIVIAVRDIFHKAIVTYCRINPFGCESSDQYSIDLPATAKKFIDDFDKSSASERIAMQELTFEIEIPDTVIERINIDEVRQVLNGHPTLELFFS